MLPALIPFSAVLSIDDDFYEELEEILIMGDIGINITTSILEHLKETELLSSISRRPSASNLIGNIKKQMRVESTEYEFENRKSVILVIVGKTTSVGKLAGKLKDREKRSSSEHGHLRCGSQRQLTQWANRAGVEIIGGQDGADPASVVYDAVAAAKARNADILICDTAEDFIIRKTLWKSFARFTVFWNVSIRKHIWKRW